MLRHLPRASRIFALTAAAAALTTISIGVWLRLGLAGITNLPATYWFVRHAHSHAGVYGIFFPLLWIVWRQLGVPSLGSLSALVYVTASTVAIVAFARGGYALPSIAASTVVGSLWLLSAWRARLVFKRGPPWLRPAPLAIVLAAAFVPAIAVYADRNPTFAQDLVHTFLAVLFLLVFAPAALARLRCRAPSMLLWSICAIAAALYLGALPGRLTGLGLLGLGPLVAFATWRLNADLPTRLAWWAFAGGAVTLGVLGGHPSHQVAMGALHFLILGPLLLTLAPPPRALRWPALCAAGAMGAILVAADFGLDARVVQAGAALAGFAMLPPALFGTLLWASRYAKS